LDVSEKAPDASMKALIVDDDPVMRLILRNICSQELNPDIYEAADGAIACRRTRSQRDNDP
jgi:hypothetical protein